MPSAPSVSLFPCLSSPITHPEASLPYPRELLSRQVAFPSPEDSHVHSGSFFPCSTLTWMQLFSAVALKSVSSWSQVSVGLTCCVCGHLPPTPASWLCSVTQLTEPRGTDVGLQFSKHHTGQCSKESETCILPSVTFVFL